MFFPRYARIYKRMKEKKIKAAYLAAYVGISPAVLSKKLNGRTPWRLDECYAVLDALEIDRRELGYKPRKLRRKNLTAWLDDWTTQK